MHICIISEGYPYKGHESFTFVKQLCIALADLGIEVSVIAPLSITKAVLQPRYFTPKMRSEYTSKGYKINIYAPHIITFSRIGHVIPVCERIVTQAYKAAIARTLKRFHKYPDVIYGHFWHSAYYAYDIAQKLNIPLFVASGESEISLHKRHYTPQLNDFVKYVSGVICVSTKNQTESIDNGLTSRDKCVVIPNAIDSTLFNKKNRQLLRAQLGYSNDDFIVAFTGWFTNRKGPVRVAHAIESINDPTIKSIFIGKSTNNDQSNVPMCPGILFKGPLPHDRIADYLNCADIFVLPTLHEGCCNAIIEAMACGLPIISSDKDFNYDILNPTCAILVNPMSIEAIAEGIIYLKNNPDICCQMSKEALKKAHDLEIGQRAMKILDFICQRL